MLPHVRYLSWLREKKKRGRDDTVIDSAVNTQKDFKMSPSLSCSGTLLTQRYRNKKKGDRGVLLCCAQRAFTTLNAF